MTGRVLPVTLISGYLGAGKTTLINRLLAEADGRRIAVMVNDFGAVNIDAALIRAKSEDLIELQGGCVCCRISGGFIEAFAPLAARAEALDHIVVETSGVSSPTALRQVLSLFEGVGLASIVTLADATAIERLLADPYVGDVVEDQVRAADRVIFTRTDLPGFTAPGALVKFFAEKYPDTPVTQLRPEDRAAELVLDASAPERTAFFCAPAAPQAEALFESFTLDLPDRVDAPALAAALARPDLGLQRAKGVVVDLAGERLLLQVAQFEWTLTPWAAKDPAARRLVVIATRTQSAAALLDDIRTRFACA